MFDRKMSYAIQETAHGFVVMASEGEEEREAWTARTIEAAANSIINNFYQPKPQTQQ